MLSVFQKAQQILGKIPNINMGGCGVAAYAMYLYLKKNNCLDNFQVVLFDEYYTYECHEQNIAFIDGESSNPNAAAHIAVTFDGGKTIYDAKGAVMREFDFILLVPMHKTEQYFTKLFATKISWNSAFDMCSNIPVIEKQLGIELNINLELITNSWI